MTEDAPLDAAGLRAMGIGHPLISSGDELIEIVTMLLDLGVELDDMIGADLTLLHADGGPGSVRIGLAAGEVVAVGGDFYGTVVHIASRSVGHAEPDTIVATVTVVNGAHASARFEPIGPRELRGIREPVELYRLV